MATIEIDSLLEGIGTKNKPRHMNKRGLSSESSANCAPKLQQFTRLQLRDCLAVLTVSDFQSSITRARFEDLCGDYFRATLGPVDKVLKVHDKATAFAASCRGLWARSGSNEPAAMPCTPDQTRAERLDSFNNIAWTCAHVTVCTAFLFCRTRKSVDCPAAAQLAAAASCSSFRCAWRDC